jgi:hypothetical protein
LKVRRLWGKHLYHPSLFYGNGGEFNLYLTPFKFLGYTRTYGLNWHLINSKCRVMHNTLYLMHFWR